MGKKTTVSIGRSAITGRYIKVSQAKARPATSVVEKIKRK